MGDTKIKITRNVEDVLIDDLVHGQTLVWDESLQKFINTTISGTGGEVDLTIALQRNWFNS